MSSTHRKQSGFGLVEVLIAAAVVGVGLLSIASLQSRLVTQSADSKARAEAVSIAQARLEELRNYTNSLDGEGAFDTFFASTSGFTNSTTIDGVNARFTRSEAVDSAGETKQLTVRVDWTDAAAVDQDVQLSTELAWESPKAVGDLGRSDDGPLISGPTGRARIGEGELPEGAATTPTGDGTELYDDGSGDLKLAVDGRIVLTLLDACQADGDCEDFVTIEGRLYIDRATQNSLEPGSVQLLASDASYCQRFYTDGDGNVVTVDNGTTSVPSTANGDYDYFDYRCYVGGGWYGNVGVLLDDGLSQTDKVCQGDPTASDASWKETRIAARRTYRGMLYRIDDSTASGYEENADGDPVIYAIGVGDGVKVPGTGYSDWVSGDEYLAGDRVIYEDYVYQAKTDHGGESTSPDQDGTNWLAIHAQGTHDFVIASLSTSKTEGENCISEGVMVRNDSVRDGEPGGLFRGVPSDFYCLNPDQVDEVHDSEYLPTTCPYPPVNGPAVRHIVSGSITVTPATTLADNISLHTSDGAGTCQRSAFDHSGDSSTATYDCDVYEWGDGWTGYVRIMSNSTEIYCTDAGADGTSDDRLHLSGVDADTGGHDFGCVEGNYAKIEGTVTSTHQNRSLSDAVIDTEDGWCSVATDGLSYECVTGVFDTETWSGTITFSTTNGVVCGSNVDSTTGVATFTDLVPGVHTADIGIVNNTNTECPQ